jgi:hypothetical protein
MHRPTEQHIRQTKHPTNKTSDKQNIRRRMRFFAEKRIGIGINISQSA